MRCDSRGLVRDSDVQDFYKDRDMTVSFLLLRDIHIKRLILSQRDGLVVLKA